MAEIVQIADRKETKAEGLSAELIKMMEIHHLTTEANQDPAKGYKLRDFLRENPEMFKDLHTLAEETRLRLLYAVIPQEGSRILTERQIEMMQSQLNEGTSSPVEMLLVDAVLLCWLGVQYAENYRTSMMTGSRMIREVEFAEKMLTRSYNRYTKALTALARVQAITREKGAPGHLRLLESAG
jgi:hypothetical protein